MKRTVFITIMLLQIYSTSIIFSDKGRLYNEKSLENIKKFIAEGDDINERNLNGNTLLHEVTDFEIVQWLILHGADVNAKNMYGNTPLHFATDPKIAELLILHGADVNAKNKDGETPLDKISYLNNPSNPKAEIDLIFAGAKSSRLQSNHAIKNPFVQKAINYVAAFKDLKTAQNVYQQTTPKDKKLGDIFDNYLYNIYPQSLENILLNSSDNDPIKNLFTPDFINKVKENNKIRIKNEKLLSAKSLDDIKQAIAEGANINAQNNNGNTILHLHQDPNIIKFLLENGADVHIKNFYGETALHHANNPDKAKLLIQHGAHVNAQADAGHTPLIFVKNPNVVKFLLESGADVHAKDQFGNTALHLNDDPYAISLLIQYGAQVNAKNYQHETPLDLATNGQTATILVIHGAHLNKNQDKNSLALFKNAQKYEEAFHNLQIARDVYYAKTPQDAEIKKLFELYINDTNTKPFERSLLGSDHNSAIKNRFKPDFIKKVKDSAVYV